MTLLKRLALHPFTKVLLFGLLALPAFFFLVTLPFSPLIKKVVLSLVILALTAFFLKLENRSFKSVGINLQLKSLKYLVTGNLVGMGMLGVTAILTKEFVGFSWQFNSAASLQGFFLMVNFYFWSVLIEELIFRGYGFQRLAEYNGKWFALISVGLLFGLFHLNDTMGIGEILATMLTTGLGHIFFGLAVLKMKNLALPLGLHMGWNLAQELLPRHPSINTESSIFHVIQRDGLEYNFASLVIPYLAIMLLGCLFLLFYKGKAVNN